MNHSILEMIDDLNDSKLERASNLAELESLLKIRKCKLIIKIY